MTLNQYLDCVLQSYKMSHVQNEMVLYQQKRDKVKEALEKEFRDQLAGNPINSGSYAKHTAINIKYDLDLAAPFKRNSFSTLEEMYETVFRFFQTTFFDAQLIGKRRQRVSVGLTFQVGNQQVEIDVVPGRELTAGEYQRGGGLEFKDLNLYDSKDRTSIQTNIQKHIDLISGNDRERNVIRLLKVWKVRKQKSLKSFLIELLTIKAFERAGNIPAGVWEQLKRTMEFIRDNIETIRLEDPANSNNIVSNTMTALEKQQLANEMRNMLSRIQQNASWLKEYFPENVKYCYC